MGCGFSRESILVRPIDTVQDLVPPVVTEQRLPDLPDPDISTRSAEDILDDDFKAEIEEAIGECIVSIPIAYRAERNRIVEEMRRSAPEPYLDLLFSEYPDVNGSIVDQMAYKLVTSKESKKKLTDQINQRIEPSFESKTADWNPMVRGMARPLVKTFVENAVNAAVDSVLK